MPRKKLPQTIEECNAVRYRAPQQDEVELFKRQKEAEAIRAKAVPEAEGIDIRTLIAGALGAKIAERNADAPTVVVRRLPPRHRTHRAESNTLERVSEMHF